MHPWPFLCRIQKSVIPVGNEILIYLSLSFSLPLLSSPLMFLVLLSYPKFSLSLSLSLWLLCSIPPPSVPPPPPLSVSLSSSDGCVWWGDWVSGGGRPAGQAAWGVPAAQGHRRPAHTHLRPLRPGHGGQLRHAVTTAHPPHLSHFAASSSIHIHSPPYPQGVIFVQFCLVLWIRSTYKDI